MLETKVNHFLGQRIEKRDARNEVQKRRIANEPHGNRDVVTPPHRHENGRGQSTTLEVVGTPPIHLQTPSLGSQGRKKGIEVVEFSACARSTERDDRPNDAEVAQADVDERAAILEFDAGVPRAEAEALARRELTLRKREVENGDQNAGGRTVDAGSRRIFGDDPALGGAMLTSAIPASLTADR